MRPLGERRNRDTIELLEQLLAESKSGRCTGVMVSASHAGGAEYSMAVTGDFARNPMLALAVNSRVGHRLNQLADSQQTLPPGLHNSG